MRSSARTAPGKHPDEHPCRGDPARSGQILIDGVPTSFRGAGDAFAAGIGMVHQHFQLIASMTVAENLLFNDESRRRGLVDRRRATELAAVALAPLGAPPTQRAWCPPCPVAARQRVEIVRVLRREVRALVLDEPTAVLAPGEAADLMALVRQMADQGTAVIVISHKLDEVLQVADHLTVLRAGRGTCADSGRSHQLRGTPTPTAHPGGDHLQRGASGSRAVSPMPRGVMGEG